MPRELKVGRLIIPPAVAAKIRDEHDLDPDEVKVATEGYRLRFRWDISPIHGTRALVFTEVGGEMCFLALYPASGEAPDVWVLRTAYPVK